MNPRMRAKAIVEVARRGDEALLESFSYDMIMNANAAAVQVETERIVKILGEESIRYSRQREELVPAEVVAVFANAVSSRVR